MADQPKGTYSPTTMILVILGVLIAVAAVLWATGFFAKPELPPNTREVYKAGVKDESGGEFIVTDPSTPGVKVTVPTVRMTNVPPTPSPSPTPSPKAAPAAK